MEEFPLALVLASQEEVFRNNNVLYRLVRALPKGEGVQSTDKLVNVVPFRRVYTFYRKQEVIDFEQLLLARPLVLQPVLHFGRGIGIHCGACYTDEPWIVMVNQTHPKILGRLQMGMDLAKQAIEKGQSVEMKFSFTDLIQRIYYEHLKQKEKEEAKGFVAEFLAQTRFTEWEHADLIVRYHGYEAKSRTKRDRKYHKTFHKSWDFDDIGSHEMQWSQIGDQHFPYPHNASVSEDELRAVLPDWTINELSPLQNIGYAIPKQNYSYAQAGHLYESFRKKKKQRHPVSRSPGDQVENEPHSPEGIEHDFSYGDDNHTKSLSRARRTYMDQENPHADHDYINQISQHGDYDYGDHYPAGATGGYDPGYSNVSTSQHEAYANESHSAQRRSFRSSSQGNEHIDANVLIQSSENANQKVIPQNEYSTIPADCYSNNLAIRKRDSDRSTNADSGYSDGPRSRGSSYDNNDHSKAQSKFKHGIQPYSESNHHGNEGLVNPAFRYDDIHEDALQKHMAIAEGHKLAKQNGERYKGIPQRAGVHHERDVKGHNNNIPFAQSKPVVSHEGTRIVEGTAESFI